MYDKDGRKGGARPWWKGKVRIVAGITEEGLGIYSLVSRGSQSSQTYLAGQCSEPPISVFAEGGGIGAVLLGKLIEFYTYQQNIQS